MKTFYIDSYADFFRSAAKAVDAERERVEYARDDVADTMARADEAEDWTAYDAAYAEYKRMRYNINDLERLAEALHDVAEAMDGLEYCGQDVLRNLGLL